MMQNDYLLHAKACMSWWTTSGPTCNYLGHLQGPEVTIVTSAGKMTWNHLDHCNDLIDDYYCYSLGWLKNQLISNEEPMSNYSAWKARGKEECAKIQEEYQFLDEEVTVGRHIFSAQLYFRAAHCAVYGNCTMTPEQAKRLHKEHVYTKCLLGDAAQEMA